jgi:hypothetical protein
MSATIRLVSAERSDLVLELRVDRIVFWRVDAQGLHDVHAEWMPVTVIFFDTAPPAGLPGDHAETLRAAVQASASQLDEDVELIASLRKDVAELQRRLKTLEAKT